jgi:hypothetical protein
MPGLSEDNSVSDDIKLTSMADDLRRHGAYMFGSVRKEIKQQKYELDCPENLSKRVSPSQEIKINNRLMELYPREEIM